MSIKIELFCWWEWKNSKIHPGATKNSHQLLEALESNFLLSRKMSRSDENSIKFAPVLSSSEWFAILSINFRTIYWLLELVMNRCKKLIFFFFFVNFPLWKCDCKSSSWYFSNELSNLWHVTIEGPLHLDLNFSGKLLKKLLMYSSDFLVTGMLFLVASKNFFQTCSIRHMWKSIFLKLKSINNWKVTARLAHKW